MSKKIKFTQEINDNEINYLDLTISKNINKHDFKIYRKPTQSDLMIPSNSNHPWKYKLSALRSMLNRLLNIPMTKKNYEIELNKIKYLASRNGYKQNIIYNMIRNIKRKKNQNQEHNKERKKKEKFISIPFNTTLNRTTRKTFQNSEYKIGFKTKNNAFNMITNNINTNKEHQDIYDKSGIYKINCTDCEHFYIGQTGRSFKSRFKEHIQALKSNNRTSMKSNFAEHLLSTNHNYTNLKNNMKILKVLNKGNRMDSTEEYFIYEENLKNPNHILNSQIPSRNPIFDQILKLNNQ